MRLKDSQRLDEFHELSSAAEHPPTIFPPRTCSIVNRQAFTRYLNLNDLNSFSARFVNFVISLFTPLREKKTP